MKKKIVVLGGGNGSAKTLSALKPYGDQYELTGIISMADSGGANGRMRTEENMLPPSDLMRASLALSSYPFEMLRSLFYKKRVTDIDQKVDGYYLGILLYKWMLHDGLTFMQAHETLCQMLDMTGTTMPVTLEQSHLCAHLSDGTTLHSEAEIDRPQKKEGVAITKVWLDPEIDALEDAAQAIRKADVILFGPGSLYTSIIAALLPKGIREAIAESQAMLIYIAGDAYEGDGEDGPTTLSGAVGALETYLPRQLDHVLYSDPRGLTEEQKKGYTEAGWKILRDDIEGDLNKKIVRRNLQRETVGLAAPKIGEALRDLIDGHS